MQSDETPTLASSDPVDSFVPPASQAAEIPCTTRFAPPLSWLLAWGTKGGLAITDQALFSGAQFVLNVLLARWLPAEGYGAFAVPYSVYLLASAVYNALLVEPMIVFGSGRHFEMRRNYLGILLRGHWLLTVPKGLVLFGSGFLIGRFYSLPVGHALCAMGIVLPLTLLVELTRRAFYIEVRPGRAAAGGALYFCALVASAWELRQHRILTPVAAILAMGAVALLTAGVQFLWLRSDWPYGPRRLFTSSVAAEHWGYGRWVLAAVFPSWTLLNLYYLVLPVWYGLKQCAALKALTNLAMPAIHTFIALGVLTIPLLVRNRDTGGLRLMRRTVRRILGVFVTGATVYLLLLWLFRTQIISLTYGGKYLEYSGLPVLLVGLVSFVAAFSVIFLSALRALERPDLVLWINVAASAVSLTLGLWLTSRWGVVGAVSGYLCSYGSFAGGTWLVYQRFR